MQKRKGDRLLFIRMWASFSNIINALAERNGKLTEKVACPLFLLLYYSQ
jgi:hypothetical protein